MVSERIWRPAACPALEAHVIVTTVGTGAELGSIMHMMSHSSHGAGTDSAFMLLLLLHSRQTQSQRP